MNILGGQIRRVRKAAAQRVRKGQASLFVIGNQKAGYQLGSGNNDRVVLLGRNFKRQNEAKKAGVEKFGVVPKAVTEK